MATVHVRASWVGARSVGSVSRPQPSLRCPLWYALHNGRNQVVCSTNAGFPANAQGVCCVTQRYPPGRGSDLQEQGHRPLVDRRDEHPGTEHACLHRAAAAAQLRHDLLHERLGHLTRGGGLTIDNLIAADVVLADGRLVRTSESELPDLFWALRGGGGNFGVVVSFSFSLQEVSDVLAGPTLWPMEAAPAVMRAFDTYMATAPEIVGGFFLFLEVPPDPSFPAELHGRRMCAIAWCVTDPDATDVFDDLLAVAEPELHGVQRMPFPAWNSAFDGLYPPGHQWYWRADFVKELSDEAIALHVEHGGRLPTMQSSMHLYPINGAAARVGKDDTAWAYRDARYGQVIVGVDPDPGKAGLLRDWTVAYHDALHPHSMGGAYVNMMMEEGQDRVRASYRDHYDRLAAVKATYDPENLFRVNQNIAPAG